MTSGNNKELKDNNRSLAFDFVGFQSLSSLDLKELTVGAQTISLGKRVPLINHSICEKLFSKF